MAIPRLSASTLAATGLVPHWLPQVSYDTCCGLAATGLGMPFLISIVPQL